MGWLIGICTAISSLFGLYFVAIAVFGSLKKRRVIPVAPAVKKLAVLIAARNEESVIGACVRSLKQQQYPAELYDIYVFPNNCTDDTAGAAQRAGARVMCPDVPTRSKGDVLKFAFSKLLNAPEKYDGYLIFDADNLVDNRFFQIANDALCNGIHAAQGYRDSKNPHANWLSGGMSMFFWVMDGLYNRTRYNLGMSATFNGTGILLSAEAAGKVGFNTVSLTEDLEMSALCSMADYPIAWLNEAKTYDEQPVNLMDSIRQRRRWFGGSVQCMLRYSTKLLKYAIKHRSNFALDMWVLFCGGVIQLLSVLPGVVIAVDMLIQVLQGKVELLPLLATLAVMLVVVYAAVVLGALGICAMERKVHKGMTSAILLFPLFMVTWFIANFSVYVMGVPTKWTEIRHGADQQDSAA